jgi:LuxR family maltose regulon positive regulatory protein
MDNHLLATKLHIPPPCQILVLRPRLIEALLKSQTISLTIVSAPAGYGKTTLVSSWLRQTGTPSAWLSLDEGDNDPVRFLQYFISALQRIVPTIQPDLLGVLQAMQPDTFEVLLNLLINEVDRQAEPFVLVLDDFHNIYAQSVLQMVTHLLEHMPPQMHLVMLTRTDPLLPLSRFRVRSQLVEIRANQLRFTREETTAFLNQVVGLKLPPDDIVAMVERTEGWIAGLQLAALSMQACKDIHSFVSAFTGSHHHIVDYLTEEVLKLQPERVRMFLLQTSILTSMCGSLCDAVIEPGDSGLENGQAMLEALEAKNLFVIPLDDRRQWYRYHHLFADMVNLRLNHLYPQEVSELHSRASQWYEQNGMISEATHHAIMGGNKALAAQLVEQNGCSLLMRGEGFTLLKWVESVAPYTHTHPWLLILKAWGLALTGSLDQVEPTLRMAEGLFSPLETSFEAKIMLGSIAAVRAHIANQHEETQLAADYAHRALEYLPVSNDFSCSMRSVATSIHGDASWMNGNLEEARNAYLEAVRISEAAGNIYMTMIAKSNLAVVLTEQGELHQAARILADTLQNVRYPDGQELPMADRFYAGLGSLSYEWNHLEAVDQHIKRCIELCKQWGNTNLLAESYVSLVWLEQARANYLKAQEAMRAAEQLLNEGRLSPRQSSLVTLALAHWWMIQGSPERASQLIQRLGLNVDDELPSAREAEYLLLLRLLMAQGEYDVALSLAERMLHKAEAGKRAGRIIELLVLQALVFQNKGDMDQALVVLGKALSLAQPEGYIRIFLDEGEPMLKLLFQAKAHRIGQGYASDLLAAQGEAAGIGLPPAQLLSEPLTRRELEVLKLIEAGCSNQDIAEKLVISMPTVKRHISNIYAKLDVESRTQAVSLGKELRLFE